MLVTIHASKFGHTTHKAFNSFQQFFRPFRVGFTNAKCYNKEKSLKLLYSVK